MNIHVSNEVKESRIFRFASFFVIVVVGQIEMFVFPNLKPGNNYNPTGNQNFRSKSYCEVL